jgi:hypothetical protein
LVASAQEKECRQDQQGLRRSFHVSLLLYDMSTTDLLHNVGTIGGAATLAWLVIRVLGSAAAA